MKRTAVLLAPTLALLLASPPAMAQRAPASTTDKATPAPLGRLFFTPERRAVLERQRLTNVRETETVEGTSMSLDGVVVRSSGKSTVWISGRAQHENDAGASGVAARLTRRQPGKAVLSAGDEAPQSVRVGDTVNRGTLERHSILGNGSIQVTPAPGKR